jgi:hypothetical protein
MSFVDNIGDFFSDLKKDFFTDPSTRVSEITPLTYDVILEDAPIARLETPSTTESIKQYFTDLVTPSNGINSDMILTYALIATAAYLLFTMKEVKT